VSNQNQGALRREKPAPSGRRRDIWVNLALLVISALLGLGICETYFRLFAPCRLYGVQYQSPQIHFFTYDDRLGWRGRPGAEGPFGSIDFLAQVKLDRLGNRSSAEPFAGGKENVLVLGDSYGWGWGVENDQLFSEAMMRGNPGLNVYNLSAPGYGTGQQYLQLTRFFDSRPDQRFGHCVLVLCLENDFDDIVAEERYSYPKPVFRLNGGHLELGNIPVPRTRAAEYAGGRRLQQSSEISIGPLNRLHTWNRFVAWRRYSGWKTREAEAAGREGPGSPEAVSAGDEVEAGSDGRAAHGDPRQLQPARYPLCGGGDSWPGSRAAAGVAGPLPGCGRHSRSPLQSVRLPLAGPVALCRPSPQPLRAPAAG